MDFFSNSSDIISIWQVFFYASLTAVATGLGAIPLFFVKNIPKRVIGLANAIAGGLMLAASFQLITEGTNHNLWRTLLGMLLGLILVVISQKFLKNSPTSLISSMKKADATQIILIVGVMTAHSFAEGIGVGVSYGDGMSFGLFITLAIAIHNIPEGLAISLVLVPKGISTWKAVLWSIVSSLPQPIMAVLAFIFVQTFISVLPVGLGFAAGAMIWMVVGEILPDALSEAPKNQVAITLTLAVMAMVAFQILLR